MCFRRLRCGRFVLFAIDRQVVFCSRFFTASQIFRGKTLPRDTLYFTPTSVFHNGYRRTNTKTFVHFAHTVRQNNICIPISLLLFFFVIQTRSTRLQTLFRRLGAYNSGTGDLYARIVIIKYYCGTHYHAVYLWTRSGGIGGRRNEIKKLFGHRWRWQSRSVVPGRRREAIAFKWEITYVNYISFMYGNLKDNLKNFGSPYTVLFPSTRYRPCYEPGNYGYGHQNGGRQMSRDTAWTNNHN